MTPTSSPAATDTMDHVRRVLAPDSTDNAATIRGLQQQVQQQITNLRARYERVAGQRGDVLLAGGSTADVDTELTTITEEIRRLEEADRRLPARLIDQEAREAVAAIDDAVAEMRRLSAQADARIAEAAPHFAALAQIKAADDADAYRYAGLRTLVECAGRLAETDPYTAPGTAVSASRLHAA